MSGETDGIPNGLHLQPSFLNWLLPAEAECDFGYCGGTLGFEDPAYTAYKKRLIPGDIPLEYDAWFILTQAGKKAAPVANPCFYAAWTVEAAGVGGGTVAAANAGEITAYLSENSSSLLHRLSTWLFRRGWRAGPTVSMMITSTKQTCSQF